MQFTSGENSSKIQLMNLSDFLKYCIISKNVKAGSLRTLESKFKVFEGWFEGDNIDQKVFEDFVYYLQTDRKVSTNTYNTYVFFLRYFDDYLQYRRITSSPCLGQIQNKPKHKPVIIILTVEEIRKLESTEVQYGLFRGQDCSRLNRIYTTFIQLLAETGMRFEEASKLIVKNVDFSAGRILLEKTKNGQYRFAYPSHDCLENIKEIIDDEQQEYVFTNMTGSPLRPQEFSKELSARAKLAGINKRVHAHLFRHSYATELLSSGVPIEVVANLLGHKDIKTTFETYAHLADAHLRQQTLKHPLIRDNANPTDIVKQWQEYIGSYKFEYDKRFDAAKIHQAIAILYSSVL